MKKEIIITIIFILIGILILIFNIRVNNLNYNSNNILNLDIPKKITKKECNLSALGEELKFLKQKIKKKKPIKKDRKEIKQNNIKNNIYVKNNTIFIKNKKYTYIGNIYKNEIYAIFKYFNKTTIFIDLKIKDKLPDSNLTLIQNSNKKLVFQDKNNSYTIYKNYIDITKYQKDKNETKK